MTSARGSDMSKIRYDKPGKHPSQSVGNQKSTSWPPTSIGKVDYPGSRGPGKSLNTERCHVMVNTGGSGGPNKNDYPGEWSYSNSFGCVKSKGKK